MADHRRSGANSPWYRCRNNLRSPFRNRIICSIVLLLCVVSLVVISFVFFGEQTPIEQPEPFEAFWGALDTSVDPCDNFYDFSCGHGSLKSTAPDDKATYDSFNAVQDLVNNKMEQILDEASESPDLPSAVNGAIKFYKLCVSRKESHSEDYKALTEYLEKVGGWPIYSEEDWEESLFDWLNATAFYNKNFETNILFDLSLSMYENNTVLSLKPAFHSDISDRLLYAILRGVNSSDAKFLLNEIYVTDLKWQQILYTSLNKTDSLPITVGELISKVPNIDWLRYFNLMFQDLLLPLNKSISLEDKVIVYHMDYMKKVEMVMNSNTFLKVEIANLFGAVFANEIFVLIPGVLKMYAEFDGDVVAEDEQLLLAKRLCRSIVDSLFAYSIEYLYIKNCSSRVTEKSKVLTMYTKNAFRNTILFSSWLDAESKSSAVRKIDQMQEVVGYPLHLTNRTEFDRTRSNFPTVTRNILESYFKVVDFNQVIEGNLPRRVTHVSAYYIAQNNKLVFPISLHNPPYFYGNGPSYLNFGASGALIGHEIMHAFGLYDDLVSRIDSGFETDMCNGIFKNRTRCFVKQYNKYDAKGTLLNNGAKTLRENVADSEGLRIAFEAHKHYEADHGRGAGVQNFSNYSSDQMFFISYATVWCSKSLPGVLNEPRVHSLPEYRVNEAVSNSNAFAAAYNCPVNSPMNPSKKCHIW